MMVAVVARGELSKASPPKCFDMVGRWLCRWAAQGRLLPTPALLLRNPRPPPASRVRSALVNSEVAAGPRHVGESPRDRQRGSYGRTAGVSTGIPAARDIRYNSNSTSSGDP